MIAAIEHNLDAISELCRRYGVARLEVFGSAATDEFDPGRSDVDFLIDYAPETDLGPWLKQYFALKQRLEALVERPVDIVMADAPAMENPYFRREAEKTRKVIYDAANVGQVTRRRGEIVQPHPETHR